MEETDLELPDIEFNMSPMEMQLLVNLFSFIVPEAIKLEVKPDKTREEMRLYFGLCYQLHLIDVMRILGNRPKKTAEQNQIAYTLFILIHNIEEFSRFVSTLTVSCE